MGPVRIDRGQDTATRYAHPTMPEARFFVRTSAVSASTVCHPFRRPSGIAAQRSERQGCRERRKGPGTALVRRPSERRWSEGTPCAQHSGPNVRGVLSFAYFSLHEQRKVRRRARRNLRCKAEESVTIHLGRHGPLHKWPIQWHSKHVAGTIKNGSQGFRFCTQLPLSDAADSRS